MTSGERPPVTDPAWVDAGTLQASPRLRWAGWAVGLLGLAALAGVALHLGEVERFVELLHSLAPAWLLLALMLQGATYFSVAVAWGYALRQAGERRSLGELLPLALAKLFVDQSMPTGGIGGTAFLVAALARRGVPRSACVAALITNLVGHYGAYLLAAIISVSLLSLRHQARPWMLAIAAAFVLVSLAVPLAVLALRRYGRRGPDWLLGLPGVRPLIDATAEASVSLLRRPRLMLTTGALNFAVMALDAGTLWTMLHALGLGRPYGAVFPSFLLAMMVTTVGPIPMGLGSFEATCVAALTLQGVPIEGALTATLLLRGCTTWLPMLPGWILARRELRAMHTGGAMEDRRVVPP